MANNGPPSDLTAFEGPDDWVSLYLDGAGDDMLTDAELSNTAADQSILTEDFAMPANVAVPTTAPDRPSAALEADPAKNMAVNQDLCLPSLDQLLADNNASDPDGLFSGFQTLSNKDLDMFTAAENNVTQSIQHSNAISGSTSEGRSPSDGSDGEMSQAIGSTRATQIADTQAPPAQAKVDHMPGGRLPVSTAPTKAALPQTEQGAFPSLAGMTAAEVAHAVGYNAAKQSQVLPGKNSAPTPAALAPTNKQANSKKKRGRDTEAAGTSSGASEQHAVPIAGVDMSSRAGTPGVSSSSDVSPGQVHQDPSSTGPSAADGEEQKRMARMQRNRESAHQSRQRKRMQMDEVEQRCEQLKQHNSQLNQLVGQLTAENIGLKQQLVHVCQQTGHPLPPPPPSAMHPYGFGQMGLPMPIPAPKVPIQKMPAVRPSPAASHMLSSSSSRQSSQHATNVQSPAQPAQARKRAKQAAGAGTVLLALFSFVIFLGPLGPLAGQGLWSGPAPGLGHLGSSQGLPASDSMTPHIGGGRVLMAVGTNTSDMLDSSSQENQTVLVIPANQSFFEEVLSIAEGSGESTGSENRPGQGQITGEAWWPRVMEAGHVEPSKSIVLRPSNKKAESQALQGLKDLAPVVLYSRWDQGVGQAQLPSGQSPWQHALPGTAQEDLSGLNGFRSPSMCKEVYQFEAQGTTAVQASQHVQRFLTSGSSMRGSGSIALPPIPPVQDPDKNKSKKPHKATIGCGEDDPGVVVSVMLPTKNEGNADDEFTSLDQLYVVVLTPGVKYSTYSCLLSKPVLV